MTKKKGHAARHNKRKRDWKTVDEAPTHAVAFGALLNQARRVARIDREALAIALDISESTLKNYLAGRTSPTVETLVRLAPLLKKHPAEFFLHMPARFYDLDWLQAPVEVA